MSGVRLLWGYVSIHCARVVEFEDESAVSLSVLGARITKVSTRDAVFDTVDPPRITTVGNGFRP